MSWFEGKHPLDPVRQPVIVLGPIFGLGSLGSTKGGAWRVLVRLLMTIGSAVLTLLLLAGSRVGMLFTRFTYTNQVANSFNHGPEGCFVG